MNDDKIGIPDTCIVCGKVHQPGECKFWETEEGPQTSKPKMDYRFAGRCANQAHPCDFEMMLARLLRALRREKLIADPRIEKTCDHAIDLLTRKGKASPLR